VVVVAQDMWWWRRRICGGGGAGYVVDKLRIMLNSAQLKAETGTELGNIGLSQLEINSYWSELSASTSLMSYGDGRQT
jgi:hypothetical protein